jgi:hypothetical protein
MNIYTKIIAPMVRGSGYKADEIQDYLDSNGLIDWSEATYYEIRREVRLALDVLSKIKAGK